MSTCYKNFDIKYSYLNNNYVTVFYSTKQLASFSVPNIQYCLISFSAKAQMYAP